MIITLEPWEYEYAAHIGIRRFTQNWQKPNAPWYDGKRMEDDRTAQIAAAITELAVAKATNRYWPATIWNAQDHHNNKWRPDVGRNIEVKRVRTRDPAVRKHQTGQNIILWAARPIPPEFREVEMLGWISMDDAWQLGTPADYDPHGNTRTISVEHLRLDGITPPR